MQQTNQPTEHKDTNNQSSYVKKNKKLIVLLYVVTIAISFGAIDSLEKLHQHKLLLLKGNHAVGEIKDINSVQLTKIINKNKQDTTLVIFASWCKACQQKLPSLINKANKRHSTKLLMVSVDDDKEQLRNFLSHNKNCNTTIYRITDRQYLAHTLQKHRINFKGTLPYTEVISYNEQN